MDPLHNSSRYSGIGGDTGYLLMDGIGATFNLAKVDTITCRCTAALPWTVS